MFTIIIDYTGAGSILAAVVEGKSTLGLFADYLTLGSLAVNGLENGFEQVVKCDDKGTE